MLLMFQLFLETQWLQQLRGEKKRQKWWQTGFTWKRRWQEIATELQLTDVELQTNKSTFVQIFNMFCNDVKEVKRPVMTKEHFIFTS